MKILHISEISNNLCNGMTTVIPCHVLEQSKIEDVYYLNLSNTPLEGFSKQVKYENNLNAKEFRLFLGQFDIVILHGLYIMEYVKIGRMLDSLTIPYVIVPHGSMTKSSQRKKWFKKKLANFLFFNRFVSHAAAIQFLSQGELDASVFRFKKSFIGTNGINIPANHRHQGENIRHISFIGRLDVFHKGLDMLIEAVSLNKQIFIDNNIQISIYGNDIKGRGAKLRKLISDFNVSDIITLNKEIFGDAKKMVLLSTDVFVLTSRFEGMPMGVLEALSYGIPCMVTEGTNLKDYIEEYNAGWTCCNSTKSVSEMLRKAIERDNNLQEKSVNALRLVNEVFSWHEVSTNTINQYRALLG